MKRKLIKLFEYALMNNDKATYDQALELQEATGLLSKAEMETYLPLDKKVNLFHDAFVELIKKERYFKFKKSRVFFIGVSMKRGFNTYTIYGWNGIPDKDLDHYNQYADEDSDDWVDDIMDTDFPDDVQSAVWSIEEDFRVLLRDLIREFEHMLYINIDYLETETDRYYEQAEISLSLDLMHPF